MVFIFLKRVGMKQQRKREATTENMKKTHRMFFNRKNVVDQKITGRWRWHA